MKTRDIVIKDICALNEENIKNENERQIIKYLDTSNITKNIINKVECLDNSLNPFPHRAKRKVKNNTIIYSTVRPNLEHFGFLAMPEDNLIVSTGFITLNVIDEKIDPKFLYYLITQEYITEYLHGIAVNNVSSYPSINPEDLTNLKFKIPVDIKDQKKISLFLSLLDSQIDTNTKANFELENMAKLIYDYWFIQFNFPNNNRPYKMNNGKMTFNNKLNRKIPNEWKVGLLSEKIKIMSGFPFSSKDYVENGKYKIITIKNVQESFLKTNKVDTINSLPRKMSNCIKLNIGDVLISLTGNVGRLCFVDEENLLLNQRVGKLICEDNFLFYGYLFFNRPENQTRLKNIAIGSDQANLSPVEMVKEYFLIPPNDVLNKFIGIVKPIFDQFIKNNQKNKQIAELKNLFLPMLVNGKLRIN